MKALSVRGPWWWLIVGGYKPIENRPRRFHYRGPLLIHASRTITRAEYDACALFCDAIGFDSGRLPSLSALKNFAGHIVGAVNLIDCVDHSEDPWFCGPHGLVLADAITVKVNPTPVKGALGLFEVSDAQHPELLEEIQRLPAISGAQQQQGGK
jgi:hypothetical protein